MYYTYTSDALIFAPKTQEDLNTPSLYAIMVRGKLTEIKVGVNEGKQKHDKAPSSHRLATYTKSVCVAGNDCVLLAHIPIRYMSKEAIAEFKTPRKAALYFEKVIKEAAHQAKLIKKNSTAKSQEIVDEKFFFDNKEAITSFYEVIENALKDWKMEKNLKLCQYHDVGLTRTAGELYFKYDPYVFLVNSAADLLLQRDRRGRKMIFPTYLKKFLDQRLVSEGFFRFN